MLAALEVRALLRALGEELGVGDALERRGVLKEPRLQIGGPAADDEELHDDRTAAVALAGGHEPLHDTDRAPPLDDETTAS